MSRKKISNIPMIQSGSATLVAGAIAVTNVTVQLTSRIILTRIGAVAPAATELAAIATAVGLGNGSFAIDSTDAADVGVIAWSIHTEVGTP